MRTATRKPWVAGMWVGTIAIAGAVWLPCASGQEKSALPEHHVLGRIRVFYAIEGVCAVPLTDSDSTRVPDHVEDVARQVWAAHRLFCEVLGFPDPLQSERYPGVTCIEVAIRDRAELGGRNGAAYDEPQRANRIREGKPEDRAIVMAVGRHVVAAKNLSPAHELFHLIQYGATYFKNGWFLEGQTRWSEHALQQGGLGEVKYSPRGPWPQPSMSLPTLFAMTYDAEFILWNPIAQGTDPNGLLPQAPVLNELADLRYSDGSPVLQDRTLTGAEIMRDILVELGRMDDVAFKELGYDKWNEDNQKSGKNDRYIYHCVMDVLRRRSPAVGRFQATKAAMVSTSRAASTPEQNATPRVGTAASADAGADTEASKGAPGGAAKWRTWTTRDGKYQVEAKLLKYASGMLTLEKKDGTTVDVKLELLCADDRDFVTQQK
jgi:hypothetical protein